MRIPLFPTFKVLLTLTLPYYRHAHNKIPLGFYEALYDNFNQLRDCRFSVIEYKLDSKTVVKDDENC